MRNAIVIALALILPSIAAAAPIGPVWISEIMHDPAGFDWGDEWVELYNTSGGDISLNNFELRWGYDDYSENTLSLAGETILANDTFVIGGPNSGNHNGHPIYDLVSNLFFLGNDPGGDDAFGIGLFDLSVSTTLPVHAVIYGTVNTDLVDELGNFVAPYSQTTNSGESLEFTGVSWVFQTVPNPNGLLLTTPEPGTGVLVAGGLAILACRSRRSRLAPRA
jgi:hypothetical protein